MSQRGRIRRLPVWSLKGTRAGLRDLGSQAKVEWVRGAGREETR